MNRRLEILGDGQVWDLRGISAGAPDKTFEDLFSGRALGEMARQLNQRLPQHKKVLSRFKEKGRITGLSVTRALLSRNKEAKKTAVSLLEQLAQNGASGITALTEGRGYKEKWLPRDKGCWKNLDSVIIGGGVSEGATGRLLVRLIKNYLWQDSRSDIRVYQARLAGKEAGFSGSVISILDRILREAKEKRLKAIGAIGLDLGREEIGVGLVAIKPGTRNKILKSGKNYWLFRHSVKTACRKNLKIFLDSRRDYTLAERKAGVRCRGLILKQLTDLIMKALIQVRKLRLATSQNIAVAVPGSTTSDGYIINSTDYLPFFRKQDGFNFARALEGALYQRGLSSYRVHIVNDGIAAGVANIYFSNLQRGKIAFLGVGSGLGGCVGKVGAG